MCKAALLFFLAAAVCPGAQEADLKVSAPFVSRLKAKAGEASILLTWRGSPDLLGPRLVYRHTEQITDANWPEARLVARLDPTANSYEDYPPDQKPYFYAVLLEDDRGRLCKLFIPFRNKTAEAVQIKGPISEQALASRISELNAVVSADSVRVRFRSSRSDRELLLFRSTTPMRTAEDLLNAAPPVGLSGGAAEYVDYPLPGLDYYYAVVDAGLFKTGQVVLEPGRNATVSAVRVPLEAGRVVLPPLKTVIPAAPPALEPLQSIPSAAPAPSAQIAEPVQAPAMREAPLRRSPEPAARGAAAPLPLLALGLEVADGEPLPVAAMYSTPQLSSRPLNPATQKAVAAILADAPAPSYPSLKAAALPEDLAARGDPETDSLRSILVGQLLAGDYAAAESRLLSLLSLRRSEEVSARAHFYLAQAYYLQGKYQQACLELLLAQDRCYTAVQPWLDACLRALYSF